MYTNGKYSESQVDRGTVLVWYLQRWTLAAICGKSVFAHGRSKFSDSKLGLADCSKLHAAQPWTTFLFVYFSTNSFYLLLDSWNCRHRYARFQIMHSCVHAATTWQSIHTGNQMAFFSSHVIWLYIFKYTKYNCWNNVCVCWNRTQVLNSIVIMVKLNVL